MKSTQMLVLLEMLLLLMVSLLFSWHSHKRQEHQQQIQEQQHLCQFHFDFVISLFPFCFICVSIWLQLFVHLLIVLSAQIMQFIVFQPDSSLVPDQNPKQEWNFEWLRIVKFAQF